ncbi:MAG: ATP-grasp domain-containing protein [Patescibacteria group bacterium]
MNTSYIYVVGQPDPNSGVVDVIHKAGYLAGILIDVQLKKKNLDQYDNVVEVNFNELEDEILRLESLNLNIAGLLCTYENYIVAKAKLGEYFNVPAPSLESARLATDKSLMRRAFLDADRTISPDFTTVDTLDQALEFARNHSYPLIIKPTNLVKSLLVLKCDDEQQLIERFTYATETIGQLYEKYKIYDRAPQLIIEEFIIGEQYSIAAFVDSEGTPHFCDGIVSLKNAQDIHVDDNYLYSRTLPVDLSDELTKEMFEVADKGVRALKMTSVPAHIELMSGPNGTKIIEIGARIGGYRPRMYNYSYGLDLISQEVNLALGKTPELNGLFSTYSAVYELFPEIEGNFDAITGEINPELLTYYKVTANQGDLIGPAKNGFKATAIIIVTEKDKNRFDELCQQVETARVKVV